VDAERKLRDLVKTSRNQAYAVELAPDVAAVLVGPGAGRLAELEAETGRRFFVATRDGVPGDHFHVLDRGPVSRLEPKGMPMKAGETIDVKLEERDRYLKDAAIGRVGGLRVTVAGGATLLGKTVRATVERLLPGIGYAVLAEADSVEPPVEAGTELDRDDPVETPKRRTRSRRKTRDDDAAVPAEDESAADRPVVEETAAAGAEPAADGDGVGEEGALERPKRKTRRGSRGGRGRKKKAAAPDAATDGVVPAEGDGAVSAEVVPEPERVEAAVEESPGAATNGAEPPTDGELGDGEPKPKKKTRRGSRGGRNRRRKPAAVETDGGAEEPATEGGASAPEASLGGANGLPEEGSEKRGAPEADAPVAPVAGGEDRG
jgi:hypothetical protein